MRLRSAIIVLTLLSSCRDAHDASNRVILPPSAVPDLLKQCSRDAPVMGEKAWLPTDANVDALEAALPRALAASPKARAFDYSRLLERWQRQYGGIVRGGRRLVYGNFFPVEDTNELAQWRKTPMMNCDGGARFFGVEFDVDANRITRIDFNGSIEG